FEKNSFRRDDENNELYARLLASIGINSLTINNVNVNKEESYFITDKYLNEIDHLASIFSKYNINLFLSINFVSQIEIGNMKTADPINEEVQEFWNKVTKDIYDVIPDFGGFVVKADSENRPGPFTYGRTHADGANMLGR